MLTEQFKSNKKTFKKTFNSSTDEEYLAWKAPLNEDLTMPTKHHLFVEDAETGEVHHPSLSKRGQQSIGDLSEIATKMPADVSELQSEMANTFVNWPGGQTATSAQSPTKARVDSEQERKALLREAATIKDFYTTKGLKMTRETEKRLRAILSQCPNPQDIKLWDYP